MSLILFISKLISPDFRQLARSSGIMQVLTISISHYAEFACWALQMGGKQFREHGYAPAQHVPFVLSLRVGNKSDKYLSSTSRVAEVTSKPDESAVAQTEEEKKKQARKDSAARATAVPVAVLPDGGVLVDSWQIADYSGLPGIEPHLKKILDEELGPLSRQLAYSHLLQAKNIKYFDQICTMNRSWIWRFLYWLTFGSSTKKILMKTFKPHDKEALNLCRNKLKGVMSELEGILEKRKGKYLSGDTIGVADLALASLGAPLVNPPLYCEGKYGKVFDAFLENDPIAKDETTYWRETPVGKYILEIYQSHRLK